MPTPPDLRVLLRSLVPVDLDDVAPRVGIFGPIVSPPPTGPAAGELFDHVVGAASIAGFYELKRGRRGGPQFGARP